MPSVRASSRPNLGGWQLQPTPTGTAIKGTPPQPPEPTSERSPYMRSSMPLMAATGDAFTRQFYSRTGLPSQRILPVGKGARA